MDAIQGAKNQALFRDAADERLRDLNEAFERVMGKKEAPADALSGPSDAAPSELSRPAGRLPMTDG